MNDATAAGPPLTHAEIRSIIIGVLVAMFLAALDQTIVATAMPTIGAQLGDFEQLPWVVTSYLLAATAVTPLYGKLSDILGRRTTLLIGISVFMIGSVLCALAPTMLTLIIARAIQGLGGGGLISLAQTVIADIVAPKERARYQAYIAGVFAASSIGGPVLGGFFAEHLSWTFIFWINLPLGLLAYGLTNSLLKKIPRHERPHRLDVIGAALMVIATLCLLLALTWGGLRFPWASAPIIALLAGSAIFWLLFAIRLKLAREPLISADLLENKVVGYGTAAAFFGMGVLIGLTIYIPIFLEGAYGLTASQSGLALVPVMVGTVTGATFSGRIMIHARHYKRVPIAGLLLAIAALLIVTYALETLPLVLLVALLTITSLGLGTILPVTTVAIQNSVSAHRMGTATGVMNFFRSLGGALTVACFGAIILSGLPASGMATVNIENFASVLSAAGLSITGIFRWIFLAAASGLAFSLLTFLMMEERPLRSKLG
ncbi:MAG: MFS transporter [Rhizobiales bacterium]|nr:MFS transporter [Hyphomicrobiales bacterium]